MTKETNIQKYAILCPTGILAESREQEGPLLFSSRFQAEAELRCRPRQGAKVIHLLITYLE